MQNQLNEAAKATEEELEELENRIAKEYSKAARELSEKTNEYFKQFQKRDAEMAKKVAQGQETPEYYVKWRLAQIGRGKRFEALRDIMAERMTKANEVALAYINDVTPTIYSLNRNYTAYEIEKGTGLDFTIFNERTVKRLVKEKPDIMPYYPPERALKRGIDLAYGKRQITAQVTTGILQGENLKQLADRLQDNIPTMNRNSAIRAARTATTEAQNAGRTDADIAAKKQGAKIKRVWVATLDKRTRHAHGKLDGQRVEPDEPFKVDGYEIMYPGDHNAEPYLVYNCRCTVVTECDGVDFSKATRWARDPLTRRKERVQGMTYEQWIESKKQGNREEKPLTKEPKSDIIEKRFTPVETKTSRKLKALGVEYNEVKERASTLTESEIIQRIAGGDMTKGSCASVALAYVGQKNGWEVLDFRDGDSRKFFSNVGNLFTTVAGFCTDDTLIFSNSAKSSLSNARKTLKQLESGKEYYFVAGAHAAIVRKHDGVCQFLELQSPNNSGWQDFDSWTSPDGVSYKTAGTLQERFGCKPSSSKKVAPFVYAAEISQLSGDTFRTILGYINTSESKQKKGDYGNVK